MAVHSNKIYHRPKQTGFTSCKLFSIRENHTGDLVKGRARLLYHILQHFLLDINQQVQTHGGALTKALLKQEI